MPTAEEGEEHQAGGSCGISMPTLMEHPKASLLVARSASVAEHGMLVGRCGLHGQWQADAP